jgi:uncharacterized protein (DUF927 family)
MNYDAIPEKLSSSRMGWIDGHGFAPYESELIFDGEYNFKNMFNNIKPSGDFDKWLSVAQELRRKDVTFRIALASSFASAILKICGSLSFFVHFWSDVSSSGKTLLIMASASIWGNPDIGAYVQTFNATDVSMERMADFYNSMPMILDELQLAKDTHGNIRFNPYKLAQGAGKGRGLKTGGTERMSTWNLSVITSGETPLTSITDGAGAYARIIEVYLKDKIINGENGNRIATALKTDYGHAGIKFINAVKEIGNEKIKTMYSDILKSLMQDSEIQDKQAMAAAAVMVAERIATDYIFKDDSELTLQEFKPFLLTQKQAAINDRAYDIIVEWVASNANRFESNTGYKTDNTGCQLGIIEDGWAYIINSSFNELMQKNAFNSKSVLSGLKRDGLIKTSGDRNTVRKSINKTQVHCVAIVLENPSFLENCATSTSGVFDL